MAAATKSIVDLGTIRSRCISFGRHFSDIPIVLWRCGFYAKYFSTDIIWELKNPSPQANNYWTMTEKVYCSFFILISYNSFRFSTSNCKVLRNFGCVRPDPRVQLILLWSSQDGHWLGLMQIFIIYIEPHLFGLSTIAFFFIWIFCSVPAFEVAVA